MKKYIICLSICFFAIASLHAQTAKEFFDKGYKASDAGNHELAIQFYTEAISLGYTPKYDALYNRGIAYFRELKYEKAVEDFSAAVRGKPNFFQAFSNRGLAKSKMKKYEEAVSDFNKAIMINAKDALVYNNRGYAREQLGRDDDALSDYEKAIQLKPGLKLAQKNKERLMVRSEIARAIKTTQKNSTPRPAAATDNGEPPVVKILTKPSATTEKVVDIVATIESESEVLDFQVVVNEVTTKGSVSKPVKKEKNLYRIEERIKLEPNTNEVYVKAINKNGVATSDPIKINCLYVDAPIDTRHNLYVLTIGISTYQASQYNLNYAHKDAADLAEVFEGQVDLPADKRLFKNVFVESLVNDDATTLNIKRKILDIKKRVNKHDLLVLHISSHGEKDPLNDFYIRTYDADADPSYLSASALHGKWLRSQIENFPCTVVQFFDTCHSGGADETFAFKGAADALKELTRGLDPESTYFFSSSGANSLSQERKEWENGAFTQALIDCFNGKDYVDNDGSTVSADINGNGYLDTQEIGNFVQRVVKIITKGEQRPRATMSNAVPLPIFVVTEK